MKKTVISNDRHILSADLFNSGFGTHHYKVSYTGEWEDLDLITAVDKGLYDNPTEEQLSTYGHYGGYVSEKTTKDGVTAAEVGVYYD